MQIIGTGLSGLVGSRVVELLSPEFNFENLSLDSGVDITNKEDVSKRIEASRAPWVFHFAAKTDVDGAEIERSLGEESPSWIVNVQATEYIVDAVRKSGKKLLYISTDFVFDGTKDVYTEEDVPNPQGWYAKTKYEGEKRVLTLGDNAVIIRIANPYRARYTKKSDFVHKIFDRMKQGLEISAPDDQRFVPTFIDDIARALVVLLHGNVAGIYHVVGSTALSPIAAANQIAQTYNVTNAKISSVPFMQYFAGRAPRPFQAVLKNDKISKLGVVMLPFADGLKEVKRQEENIK